MKEHTEDYISEEITKKRKPIELYHLWREGGQHWRYTSYDKDIVYGGNTFTPTVVARGSVRYDAQLEVTTLRVAFGYVYDPVIMYIAQNPVEVVWIDIQKYYEDVSPPETSVIFIGQIKTVSFEGNEAQATCVGFEHYLNQKIPKYRYQTGCNNDLFDSFCLVDPDDYLLSTTITAVDTAGVILTSSDFALQDDGYYTRGHVQWGDYRRMIVHHEGSDITIRFKIPDFTSGQAVDAWPGCDRQLLTCYEKFNNVDGQGRLRFFGHPWIPLDNPAKWVP